MLTIHDERVEYIVKLVCRLTAQSTRAIVHGVFKFENLPYSTPTRQNALQRATDVVEGIISRIQHFGRQPELSMYWIWLPIPLCS